MLFLCDARWRVVGASGFYRTVREAKRRAERFYPGISKAWRRTGNTKTQANRLIGADRRCSVCAKLWFAVEKMVVIRKRELVLCDGCIRELYEMILSETSK